MRLRIHKNGRMYPYPDYTRLGMLITGIVFIPILIGLFFVYEAIMAKCKWSDSMTQYRDKTVNEL